MFQIIAAHTFARSSLYYLILYLGFALRVMIGRELAIH